MASAYPGGLDTFATNKANATATTTDHPAHHNDLADAVNKIEAELGITPSGSEATVAARFSGLTSSERALTLPPASGWSWVNQGSSTVTDPGNGQVVIAGPSAGGNNLVARVRTAPATPYVVTANVSYITRAGNDGSGLCFRESGTGELCVFYFQPGNLTYVIENWTDHDSFSAQPATAAFVVGTRWLRIADDGTDLVFSVSADGFDASFVEVGSVGRTSFMAGGPDQIGLLVRNDGQVFASTLHSWEVD